MSKILTISDETYDLIKDQIEELEGEKKRWKPKEGETYWYIDCEGDIIEDKWYDGSVESFRFGQRNCFKTEKEVKKDLKWLNALAKVSDYIEENHYFVPDWNGNENKFFFTYNYKDKEFSCDYYHYCSSVLSQLPLVTSLTAGEDVIKNCKADLEIIFKV